MRIYEDLYLLFEYSISELFAEKSEVHQSPSSAHRSASDVHRWRSMAAQVAEYSPSVHWSVSDLHRWQLKDEQEAKYSTSVHRSASDVNRWAVVDPERVQTHPQRYYLCLMNPLKIGGVPEHFNLPWQLALEKGLFDRAEIPLEWTFYAGGTGAMTAALKRGDLDMAILLTEGFVSAINAGLEAGIVRTYIQSPLVWGIYTGVQNSLHELRQQQELNYAVSRFGSGSHLMAMIHADQREIAIPENNFVIVNSLHGALDSLEALQSDVFYWEKFMTRPFVKTGQLREIGQFHAPWSGFLIVASAQALEEKGELIKGTLDMMIPECIDFKQNPQSIRKLTSRFDMNEKEASAWLEDTIWNNGYEVEWNSLVNAKNALAKIGFCRENLDLKSYLAPWVKAV